MGKIYTKTGDNGETGLVGGRRVRKDDPLIGVFGELDELSAVLGMCRAEIGLIKGDGEFLSGVSQVLKEVQDDLMVMGGVLAGASDMPELSVEKLEEEIDKVDDKLPPIANFILPGGSKAGAQLHFARAVCRRCERLLWKMQSHIQSKADSKIEPELKSHPGNEGVFLAYLNRLSDLLFVLARGVNVEMGVEEEKWGR